MRDFFDVDAYLKKLEQTDSILFCEAVPVPAIADNQNYIFVSYSHQDYKRVYADLAVLYRSGIRFWYDRGLSAGKNWDAEVKDMIENPRCCGVIFYLSEHFFLSKSTNTEVDLVCGKEGAAGKNYFCVNLTEGQPSAILKSTLRMDDAVLEQAGLDMDRIAVLARAFSDKQTYLAYNDREHCSRLLKQIAQQFDVMELQAQGRGYLTRKGSDETIRITEDSFIIGKVGRKCHYAIENDNYVSSVHLCIHFQGTGSSVMDMGTINGTLINGEKIPSRVNMPIHDGDEITIGQQILIFHSC